MGGWSTLLRSLKKSTDGPVETAVKGTIPKWLNGTLYRNGPGRYEFGGKRYDHLFDGQACVHKFSIKNGEVHYTNKLLESKSYLKSVNENRLYPSFGTADAQSNIVQRVMRFLKTPEHADNVNVNVVPFAKDQLYAMTEISRVSQLDPSDLSIMKTVNMSEKFPDLKSMIAHPHIEKDGGWVNCGISVKKGKGFYTFIRCKGNTANDAVQEAELIAEIPSTHTDGFGYFHSFAITENYIVFFENPLRISFKQAMISVLTNKPLSESMLMNDSFPTKIHVINKWTGEVLPQQFYTDPQFSFHHINAFEKTESENNVRLMVDVSSYDSKHFDINKFTFENMYSGNLMETDKLKALAKRIEIPVNLKERSKNEIYCTMTDLNSKFAFEAPTINYWHNNGIDYRYIFGVNHYKNPISVCKMDLKNPTEIIEKFYFKEGQNFLPAEPVFVQRPNAESEDDGVVLVMVLSDGNDYLSILDGKTLNELARADMPEDVKGAMTFHGFFADNQTNAKLNV